MVEGVLQSPGSAVEWWPAEIMNVEVDESGNSHFYVHFLQKDKSEDDWLSLGEVRPLDIGSLRGRVEHSEILNDEFANTIDGNLWPAFFQLSQLTKQTTAGSSVYGSSSAHHDPNEYCPKAVRGIHFGSSSIKAWYRSPFPSECWSFHHYLPICDYCLRFGSLVGHACGSFSMGHEVYTKGSLSVFEVDGAFSNEYCERLFLLAKLFLEDKRTSSDEATGQSGQVAPFLFYVLLEKSSPQNTEKPFRFVGYFSKSKLQKKESPILSCILILPTEQRKGFGKLLISVAYELAKREGRQGSAERPLSGPGHAAFMSWWAWKLRTVLETCYDGEVVNVSQLAELAGMTSEDVVETLKGCGALKQWGSTTGPGDVKLRESGKKAKVKLTLDIYKTLEKKAPRDKPSPNEFDPQKLSDTARLCPVVQTPRKH